MNKHIRLDYMTELYPLFCEDRFIFRFNETHKEERDVKLAFIERGTESLFEHTNNCLAKMMVFENGDNYDVVCGNGILRILYELRRYPDDTEITQRYLGYVDMFIYPAEFNNAETRIGLMKKYYDAFYERRVDKFWGDNQWALDIDCSKLRSI